MTPPTLKPVAPEVFVPTSVFSRIQNNIEIIINGRQVCVIRGPAGIGKSSSIAMLVDDRTICAFEIAQNAKSVGRILESTCEALGVPMYSATSRILLHDLIGWIRKHEDPPCLIVDEAQNAGADGLRMLLSLNEHTGMPLVLCGNHSAIKQTKANATIFDQIEDRVDAWINLDKPTPDDIRLIAIEYDVEGLEAYQALEQLGMETSLRRVVKVLRLARQFAGPDGPIKLNHIMAALNFANLKERDKLSLFKKID